MEAMMVEVVYLGKGERRPPGDKSVLIECKPRQRGQKLIESSSGVTFKIRPEELEEIIAGLNRKGVKKVYVRKGGSGGD